MKKNALIFFLSNGRRVAVVFAVMFNGTAANDVFSRCFYHRSPHQILPLLKEEYVYIFKS